ncbi:hypothetical protein [Chloroflexus sp.]|uniref:hypothetical protein n=1 Tax=Chloroflexus sp. TaxID=1904827 RepID=UPI002ACE6E59|nr:hypothetical protein [Chloroflexus sp.]MCX7858650.1 hypothetical protein [Chloroflexus sp.]
MAAIAPLRRMARSTNIQPSIRGHGGITATPFTVTGQRRDATGLMTDAACDARVTPVY